MIGLSGNVFRVFGAGVFAERSIMTDVFLGFTREDCERASASEPISLFSQEDPERAGLEWRAVAHPFTEHRVVVITWSGHSSPRLSMRRLALDARDHEHSCWCSSSDTMGTSRFSAREPGVQLTEQCHYMSETVLSTISQLGEEAARIVK